MPISNPITSRPYHPSEKCCEKCVFGSGRHLEECPVPVQLQQTWMKLLGDQPLQYQYHPFHRSFRILPLPDGDYEITELPGEKDSPSK